MKKRIVLTGGGSGGHVYPLLAVADELRRLAPDGDSSRREKLKLFYVGPRDSWSEEFESREIKIYRIAGAKLRRYFDPRNLIDIPKFFIGFFQALVRLYFLMPDLIFSKGGTGALPVVFAARFYLIPVIIHDSDSIPGLVNRISSRFAKKIFISFRTAADYFRGREVELVGNPIRLEMLLSRPPSTETAKTRIRLKSEEPLVVFMGGSQGAVPINDFVFGNFEKLAAVAQIFHQVGTINLNEAERLQNSNDRYRYGGLLDAEQMKAVLAAADVVVSRAGSGAIFEIASFGKPSILIPLPEAASDHQRVNAYEYARNGAAIVIEQSNLSFGIIKLEIEKILNSPAVREEMSRAARSFAKPDAAEVIAQQILGFRKP